MERLVLITSSFPFGAGEQFLESEVKHWDRDDIDVVIAPVAATGRAREVPSGISVDTSLADVRTPAMKRLFLLRTLIHPLLVRELFTMARVTGRPRLVNIRTCVYATSNTLLILHALRRLQRKLGDIDLIYSYWGDVSAIAAVLLKEQGRARRVVARSHGSDLYEHCFAGGYSPLKRAVLPYADLVCPVSDNGREHLLERFDLSEDKVVTHRLSVDVPSETAVPSPAGEFRVLSCSSLTDVKRVDRIVDALAIAASSMPDRRIRWMHVGDGDQAQVVHEHAARVLPGASVLYEFAGQVEHTAVLELLIRGRFDVFVNSSSSEGVPVSAMEAMAAGIPVIAPTVGGIPELLDSDCGWLTNAQAQAAEIAQRLVSASEGGDNAERRSIAREKVQHRYGVTNYDSFISQCLELMRHEDVTSYPGSAPHRQFEAHLVQRRRSDESVGGWRGNARRSRGRR